MTELRIPQHVHAGEAPHGGTVLFNARSGQWYAMNGTARELWEEWRRTGDFDTGVQAVADRFPGLRYDNVRLDAEKLADDLVERGLVAAGKAPTPATEATPDVGEERASGEAACAPQGDGVRGLRTAGWLGLCLALLLLRLPFRVPAYAVDVLKRPRSRLRPATMRQAESMLAVVRRAADGYPGRAACLEHSLGTVLGLALAGLTADWCLGSADDPYRFHAWVEIDGETVTRADADDRVSFRRVLVL
ncbi:lasso peptide biosynthesis B2 protein [Streptomyces flavidovirens]|uniref:lasso peptide biosynthesis B2 protein n=1 Tax=Streptomyces flavidovirens TaxID=67298 RepID=UPI00368A1C49